MMKPVNHAIWAILIGQSRKKINLSTATMLQTDTVYHLNFVVKYIAIVELN